MNSMTKNDIKKLAFSYGYCPSYSGKERTFYFRVLDRYGANPTEEQEKHLSLYGTIVN